MPNVYRLNEIDWVAAENIEQATEWYMKETGLDKEESLDETYAPYIVENLSNFYVIVERYGNEVFEKDYLEDEDDSTMSVPGDELLKKEWKGRPYIFCSSEE